MARPRVFISSTFYDLRHVRSSLESFIASLGYEPVLSEKGSIAYSPDVALDESCYREAQVSDIFVLIVGGRYGSEASGSTQTRQKTFYDRYDSITRKEYESAIARGIPTYVLIEKGVHAEYETFTKNRDNTTIRYAHVDSVNVFEFIDYVMAQPRNSPIYQFEVSTQIESWLREQWAGLFRDLIRTRSDREQLASLTVQVSDLGNVSETLKRYLEELVARVEDKQEGREIISQEESKLSAARLLAELERMSPISDLKTYGVSTEAARDIFAHATSLEDLARRVGSATNGRIDANDVIAFWKAEPDRSANMNAVRKVLGLGELPFAGHTPSEAEPHKTRKRKAKSNEQG